VTRGEIRDVAIGALRESAIPVRWSEAELNHYIDDGYIEMAETTGAVVATRNLSANTQNHFVSLPLDCNFVIAAKDQADGLPIDPVHWGFVDEVDNKWIRVSSTRPDFFAMFGLRELILYPAYDSARTIEAILSIIPDPLGENDEPDLPQEYHYGLVHYCHARAIIKDAHGDETGPRIGRHRRQERFYREAMSGLGHWTFDRHKHIFMATYGDRYRMPEIDNYGVALG